MEPQLYTKNAYGNLLPPPLSVGISPPSPAQTDRQDIDYITVVLVCVLRHTMHQRDGPTNCRTVYSQRDRPNSLVIKYTGDEQAAAQFPHGNSKNPRAAPYQRMQARLACHEVLHNTTVQPRLLRTYTNG